MIFKHLELINLVYDINKNYIKQLYTNKYQFEVNKFNKIYI